MLIMTCRDVTMTTQAAILNFEAAILNREPAVIQLTMKTSKNIWICSKKHT